MSDGETWRTMLESPCFSIASGIIQKVILRLDAGPLDGWSQGVSAQTETA